MSRYLILTTKHLYLGQSIVSRFYYKTLFDFPVGWFDIDTARACAEVFRDEVWRRGTDLLNESWRDIFPSSGMLSEIVVNPLDEFLELVYANPYTLIVNEVGNYVTSTWAQPDMAVRINFNLASVPLADVINPATRPPETASVQISPLPEDHVDVSGFFSATFAAKLTKLAARMSRNLLHVSSGALFYPVRATQRTFLQGTPLVFSLWSEEVAVLGAGPANYVGDQNSRSIEH